MTIRAVADTHAVIWYVFDDPYLSSTARLEMDMAVANGEQIAVSSISLLGVPLISRDGKIRSSSVKTIW